VVFGYLIERALNWGHINATLEEENKVRVVDVLHEVDDDLDFKDRVVNMSLGFNHLVATTTTQCSIYNVVNWDSPAVFDVKEIVTLIVQGSKHFCLLDRSNGIMIYNYSGSLASSPKYSGLRIEFLNKRFITLGPDVISILDTSNPKIIRSFDIGTSKATAVNIEHILEITDIVLNQTENSSERKIAFLDVNKDLFISPVHRPAVVKISAMVDTFMWNEHNDTLACFTDSKLVLWLFPNGVFVDKDLMEQAKLVKETRDLGKYPQMLCFTNSVIQYRRFDGVLAAINTLPHASKSLVSNFRSPARII
jgi:intraflagellar transport protein 80